MTSPFSAVTNQAWALAPAIYQCIAQNGRGPALVEALYQKGFPLIDEDKAETVIPRIDEFVRGEPDRLKLFREALREADPSIFSSITAR